MDNCLCYIINDIIYNTNIDITIKLSIVARAKLLHIYRRSKCRQWELKNNNNMEQNLQL